MIAKAPTWHIACMPGDIAKTVLMPGDPKRSAWIAKHYLTDARLVNDVRGIQGYTGYSEGKRVTVMASGMGMPTMGIYAHELFEAYDVDQIIRIGTAGAMAPGLALMDVVAGMSASTNSNYAQSLGVAYHIAPTADFGLLLRAKRAADALGVPLHIGPLFSTDALYASVDNSASLAQMGILASEMESAALYLEAMRMKKKALCLCTISDSLFDTRELTAEEKESGLNNMIKIALSCAE